MGVMREKSTPEIFRQAISELEARCRQCKTGKAIACIREALEAESKEPQLPGIEPPEPWPAPPRPEPSKPGTLEEKEERILAFLASRATATPTRLIAGWLKCERSTARLLLRRLADEKKVVMTGKARATRWSLVEEPAGEKEPEADKDVGEQTPDSKPFKCDECGARFHVKGSLISHMRLRHQ